VLEEHLKQEASLDLDWLEGSQEPQNRVKTWRKEKRKKGKRKSGQEKKKRRGARGCQRMASTR
jgi:hypothetical protein